MSELKLCPFCGRQPEVEPINPKTEGDAWARVKCSDHHHGVWIDDGSDVCDERGSKAYKDEAIRRWNHRPLEADLELRIGVAVKVADHLKAKNPVSVEVILGTNHLSILQLILTMAVSELHVFLEKHPEYKP